MNTMLKLDMLFDEYLAHKAISKSGLMQLRKTPAHLKAYLETDSPSTPSQKLGSLAHCMILEPETYPMRYAMAPTNDARTKEYKAFLAEISDDRIAVKPNDVQAVVNMLDAIDRKPLIRQLIKIEGMCEVSMFWKDPLHGFDCKGRADKLIPKLNTVMDLKTNRDLSDHGIQKAIYQYGYHLQAAWYLDGLKAIGESYDRFVILWVENESPYEVRATVFDYDDDWMDIARRELDVLRMAYDRCLSTGEWPGYDDGIEEAPLPPAWLQGLEMNAA